MVNCESISLIEGRFITGMISDIELEYSVVRSKLLSEGLSGGDSYGMRIWCRVNGAEETYEIHDVSDSREEMYNICRKFQNYGILPVCVKRALDCYFEDRDGAAGMQHRR